MIGSKRVHKAVVACIYLLVLVMIYSFSQVDVAKDVKKSEDRIPPLVEQKLREKLAKFENTILNKCRESDTRVFSSKAMAHCYCTNLLEMVYIKQPSSNTKTTHNQYWRDVGNASNNHISGSPYERPILRIWVVRTNREHADM